MQDAWSERKCADPVEEATRSTDHNKERNVYIHITPLHKDPKQLWGPNLSNFDRVLMGPIDLL